MLIEVIWGHISDGAVIAAKENLISVKDELRNDQTKRWQAIGMLKHVFASVSLPWELKEHMIDFLLCITNGNISRICNDEDTDCSSYMPTLFAALQVVFCHFKSKVINETLIFCRGSESDIFCFLFQNIFQAVQRIIIHASNTVLRRKAFDAFKKVKFLYCLIFEVVYVQ